MKKIKYFANDLLFRFLLSPRSFSDVSRLKSLCGLYKGQDFFLIGSAPSIQNMPLNKIFEENLNASMVNLSFRALDGYSGNIHFVSDNDCYSNYFSDFSNIESEFLFCRAEVEEKKTSHIGIPYRKGGVLKRGFQDDVSKGLGNDSSVMVFSLQVLYYLGVRNVYIVGCDLSYDGDVPYAYALDDNDWKHEKSQVTQQKRKALVNTASEISICDSYFRTRGGTVYNCGLGGNLNSVERLDFEKAVLMARDNSRHQL